MDLKDHCASVDALFSPRIRVRGDEPDYQKHEEDAQNDVGSDVVAV